MPSCNTLTIDLNTERYRTTDGVVRYLAIVAALKAADFAFELLDDLFPATPELEQPYTMDVKGSEVTFTQWQPEGRKY